MTDQTRITENLQTAPDGDLESIEAPVKAFFDQHADYYEQSWDLREHGLNVGIFENGDDLEEGYQRSRVHVIGLLNRIYPLASDSRVLDVCCGTGATLAQVIDHHGCAGVGVDISETQLAHAQRLRNHRGRRERGDLMFRQGSASLIDDVVRDQAPFTHVFSQEGLLFAHDKHRAVKGMFDLLAPGGALVISDFVPQASKEDIDAALRARVYEDVKWAGGLSFQQYLTLLKETGFELVQAELRPLDMERTYEKLIPRTEAMAADGGEIYSFLAKRYAGIVTAIRAGALSWGWLAARKP